MARIGVSYYEVADTAEALKAQGFNPTVDRIIGVLGTGSRTTINNHLRTWKSQLNTARQQGHLKESLGSVLSQKAADVYEALEAEAAQRFESVIKEQQEEIEKLKAQLATEKEENSALLEKLDQSRATSKELEFQLATSRARSAELDQVLQDCRLSLAESNTRVADHRAHIASLKESEAELKAQVEGNTHQLKIMCEAVNQTLQEQVRFSAVVVQNLVEVSAQGDESLRILSQLNAFEERLRGAEPTPRPFARSTNRERSRRP